jgi:hypothetical protein
LQTKFSKTACLAIIQLNILVKERINITTPFYDEISKYSQSILANITVKNASQISLKLVTPIVVATNVKKYKTKTKNIYLEYFVVA